jgi:hypothetical protein
MDLGKSTSRLIEGPLNSPGGDDHPYLACQLSVF